MMVAMTLRAVLTFADPEILVHPLSCCDLTLSN